MDEKLEPLINEENKEKSIYSINIERTWESPSKKDFAELMKDIINEFIDELQKRY